VEGVATVIVGEQDTPHQAHAAAVESARAAAVQDFLGVNIHSKMLDFQQEGLRREAHLTESLLETTRNGRIIKEKELEHGLKNGSDCAACRYSVTLRACVVPIESTFDKDFHLELQASRARFVQGDAAEISMTATRDCWVYVYDVYDLGAQAKTALLIPEKGAAIKMLKAGETWVYPDADAKKRGVRLVAQLPRPTDDDSAEVIRAIATRTPIPQSVYDPTDGGYLGVLQRLHRSKTDWTEDSVAYTIYKQ
jgi:hypothetical protein